MRFFLILLFITNSLFADSAPPPMITKVISLHYVQAQTLIPQLTPLLQPGENVSGNNSSLIVNVSQATLTKIRPIIFALDKPEVVFIVSIHQGDENWIQDQQQDDVVYSATSRNESGNAQSVSVMSGETAFVNQGTDKPVISAVQAGWVAGVSYDRQQNDQGFYVTPILQGNQVKVSIRRMRGQSNPVDEQSSQNQSLETTTMVPLNKWVKLGATGQSDINSEPSSTDYTAQGSYTNETSLYIKVSISR